MTYRTFISFKHETMLKIQWIMSEFGWSQCQTQSLQNVKVGHYAEEEEGLLRGFACWISLVIVWDLNWKEYYVVVTNVSVFLQVSLVDWQEQALFINIMIIIKIITSFDILFHLIYFPHKSSMSS